MTSLYTRIVAGLLFPLHERLKQHDSVAIRKRLEHSQWLNPQELNKLQLAGLQALVHQAWEHVPYYRQLMEAQGFGPGDVRALADLQRFPLLDKATIRANTDAMKADNATGLRRFNTGGSTGEPLIFFLGNDRVSHDVAAKWRATRWWGVDIGDREIVVWGSPVELGAQDRIRGLRDRLLRSRLIHAFEMSVANLDHFIAEIRHFQPTMLFGYPSSLALIAEHAEGRGVAMDQSGIQVAFVTSERLYDHQSAAIQRVFGCPVANGYGGRDAGFIAHACPNGGMHISAEDIIVEILDADGLPLPPGQAGEVTVTHLATGSFPFIRYRTGDIAVLDDSRCTCGRGLPMLREIQGRSTDFIIAADGTVMHGLALIYILRDLPEVANFKIEQESLELTRVSVVPAEGFDADIVRSIQAGFRQRLGADVLVEVIQVDQIPREISGKFRYVSSKVDTRSINAAPQ